VGVQFRRAARDPLRGGDDDCGDNRDDDGDGNDGKTQRRQARRTLPPRRPVWRSPGQLRGGSARAFFK